MLLGDLLRDGQSEPGPAGLPRPHLVRAPETFEDMRQIVRRRSRPRVNHRDRRRRLHPCVLLRDAATAGCELDGVVDQDQQQSPQPVSFALTDSPSASRCRLTWICFAPPIAVACSATSRKTGAASSHFSSAGSRPASPRARSSKSSISAVVRRDSRRIFSMLATNSSRLRSRRSEYSAAA